LRDVSSTYDDRFYRYVWLDNTFFVLQFKYLGAAFTLAPLSADQLVVSVADLFCSWNPGTVQGPDGDPLPAPPPRAPLTQEELEEEEERFQEQGESGDYDHAPPLAYTIDAGRVLFRNTAWENEEEEHWQDLDVPRPLVFSRARGTGEPQPHVTFHRGARPAPSCPAEESGEGFVAVEWESWDPLELLTDAGGRLGVGDAMKRCAIKLDRHPSSAREPVDVLRCRLRLADSAGDLWEGVSLCTPKVFFEKLIDLDRIDLHAAFEKPDSHWAPDTILIANARGLVDDGAWRYLIADDDLIAFHGSGQKVSIDVGVGKGGLVVRISGLVGRRRPIEVASADKYVILDPQPRAAEVPGWDHEQPLPPLVYSLPVADLAFHNTTFAVDDGFWHQSAIPIPVVFQRVGTTEPTEGVVFVPDAR
jgi:hypothetical protein